MSYRKILVSAAIVVVLGFQTLASFQLTPGPVERSPFLWPFLDYPMYSVTHEAGDTIQRPRVYGLFDDSTRVHVEPSDLGLEFWLFRRGLIFSLVEGDTSRVRLYARRYARRHGRSLDGFRLSHRPVVVRETGAEAVDEIHVETMRFGEPTTK